MNDSRIQSLVAVQAIKDFLKLDAEAATKKRCVIAIVGEIKVSKGETLSLVKLDNVLFNGQFMPFITDMMYDLKSEFTPVKSIFSELNL
nr:hypothetical protein [Vibrio splendidus]MCC4882524.1 hypothetical protein [Vibrio splendidus]